MSSESMRLAAERVISRCREIAAFTEVPGETCRPFLCESARAVQALVSGWMRAAGMTVRMDAAGNVRGLYAGKADAARRLLIGSHLDTVPNAGAFDGILGVVMAISAVEQLRGRRLQFAIEVLAFSEEEGVRFGLPFLGSMALVGRLDDSVLALKDRDGVSVEAALRGSDAESAELTTALVDEGAIGFVEVHIEQGPVLESAGTGLGLVEAIAGQTRLLLRFSGRANHAGTTPMALRQDPVVAAAEWIAAVEARARATVGLVATVGRVEVIPGAANVIAGEVLATIDVRHADDDLRIESLRELTAAAHQAGAARGVTVRVETTLEQASVAMEGALVRRLEQAAARAGHRVRRMTSGAGHDAMVLAEKVPAAMLFVRSPGGLSHHPDEAVLVEDAEAALETMMEFLAGLGDDGAERLSTDA